MWDDLDHAIKNKRNFYSIVIGGRPRSNSEKWDNFEN